jgi:hypothetical protein
LNLARAASLGLTPRPGHDGTRRVPSLSMVVDLRRIFADKHML